MAGKAVYSKEYNNYTIMNPLLFEPHLEKLRNIFPEYRKVPGVSDEMLRRAIDAGIHMPEMRKETLPEDIVWEYDLLPHASMYQYLHLPRTMEEIDLGRQRMLFDDLLYFAIRQKLVQNTWETHSSYTLPDQSIYGKIANILPYRLTDDQLNALGRMIGDIRQGKRLNSILQGDVGSGKSIIAYILAAHFAKNGYQSVVWAPTQILAMQHYTAMKELLEQFDIRIAYLASGMKAAEKRKILEGIRDGYYHIVTGTHAVLSDKVVYKKLALVVTDEEHKFGVQQKEKLLQLYNQGYQDGIDAMDSMKAYLER